MSWFPDVSRWAKVVAGLLRPGRQLFARGGHPLLSDVDDTDTDSVVIGYPYFERDEPPFVYDPGR